LHSKQVKSAPYAIRENAISGNKWRLKHFIGMIIYNIAKATVTHAYIHSLWLTSFAMHYTFWYRLKAQHQLHRLIYILQKNIHAQQLQRSCWI